MIRSDGTPLGSATGLVQLGGTHVLELGTTAGAQRRTFTRNIELLNTTSSIATGGVLTLTLAGTISGAGAFRHTGTDGAIVLAGSNAYSGSTHAAAAGVALVAASDTAFGNSTVVATTAGPGGAATASTIGFQGNVNIGATAKVILSGAAPTSGLGSLHNFGGANTFAGNIELGSTTPRPIGVEAGSALTLTGIVSQPRGLAKLGDGTLVLANGNTYGSSTTASQGATTVRQGTLRLDFSLAPETINSDIINHGAAAGAMSHLVLGSGTLEVKGRGAGTAHTQRFENSGTFGHGLTVGPGASAIVVDQNGADSITLSLGQLKISSRPYGGTLDFTLPTAGSIVVPSGTSTVGVNGTILTANGAAFATVGGTDWAALDASGGRTVVAGSSLPNFYAPNTADALTGNADMSADVSTTLAAPAFVTSLRFNDGGAARTIDATGQSLTAGGILVTAAVGNNLSRITGGTLTAVGAPGNQDLIVLQNNEPNDLQIDSTITDTGGLAVALTKSGKGRLVLTGANSYTGPTTINQGILKAEAGSLGGGTLVFNGGVLGLTTDFTRPLGVASGQVRFIGSGGFAAYGGDRIVNIGGDGAATNFHATANFIPTLSALILGAPDADGTLIYMNPINTLAGASSPINRTIRVENGSAAVDGRLAGEISGAGGIMKTGAGTLALDAENTYAGGTTVAGGAVLVNNAAGSGTGSGAVEVNGGTIGGTGTMAGALFVNGASASVAPGSGGAGTLTAGDLTLATGASFFYDLLATPVGGDRLVVNSATVAAPTAIDSFTLHINALDGTLANGSYTIIDGATPLALDASRWFIGNNNATNAAASSYAFALDANGDLVLSISTIGPATSVWDKDDSTSTWSDTASWIGGVPNAPGAVATFGARITAAQTVNVDGTQTIGTINFDNANKYTLAPVSGGGGGGGGSGGGGGGIVIDGATAGAVNVVSGSHEIAAPLTLNKNTTFTVAPTASMLTVANLTATGVNITKAGDGTLTVNHVRAIDLTVTAGTLQVAANASATGVSKIAALSITGTGTLDLTDNKLITSTPAGTASGGVYGDGSVQRMVQTAYAGGAWSGPGLTTSMSDARSGLTMIAVATAGQLDITTFAGQSVAPTDTIVFYTYGGDSNFDGKIDADDYGTIDFNILVPGASGYANGDFNYDGVVNADDYGSIDFNILAQGAPFPTSGTAVTGVAAVPEPSALGFALLATAGIFGRRRRRTRRCS